MSFLLIACRRCCSSTPPSSPPSSCRRPAAAVGFAVCPAMLQYHVTDDLETPDPSKWEWRSSAARDASSAPRVRKLKPLEPTRPTTARERSVQHDRKQQIKRFGYPVAPESSRPRTTTPRRQLRRWPPAEGISLVREMPGSPGADRVDQLERTCQTPTLVAPAMTIGSRTDVPREVAPAMTIGSQTDVPRESLRESLWSAADHSATANDAMVARLKAQVQGALRWRSLGSALRLKRAVREYQHSPWGLQNLTPATHTPATRPLHTRYAPAKHPSNTHACVRCCIRCAPPSPRTVRMHCVWCTGCWACRALKRI